MSLSLVLNVSSAWSQFRYTDIHRAEMSMYTVVDAWGSELWKGAAVSALTSEQSAANRKGMRRLGSDALGKEHQAGG